MKTRRLASLVAAFAAGIVLCAGTVAFAQKKYTISQSPDIKGQFLQEHAVEVGDVPGHFLVVQEIRNDFPQRDLTFAGVVVNESYIRSVGDFVNGSGAFSNYIEYRLEDGNKIYSRSTGTSQTDGGAFRLAIVETFIGGTGKFKGMRGHVIGSGERAVGANSLTVQYKGEYWIEE